MRSTILMGSVAAIALATPAMALPDRYEQGYSCTGQGAQCIQEQMRLDDGNRSSEKGIDQSNSGGQAAARSDSDNSDDSFGDEVGERAENAADEAGDEISEGADEAGDAIDNAADEVGDEIGDAF